jgi:hypothetical protein
MPIKLLAASTTVNRPQSIRGKANLADGKSGLSSPAWFDCCSNNESLRLALGKNRDSTCWQVNTYGQKSPSVDCDAAAQMALAGSEILATFTNRFWAIGRTLATFSPRNASIANGQLANSCGVMSDETK